MEKGQMRAPVYEALEKLKKRRVMCQDIREDVETRN